MQRYKDELYLSKENLYEYYLCGGNSGLGILNTNKIIKIGIDETMYGLYCHMVLILSDYRRPKEDARTPEAINESIRMAQIELERLSKQYIVFGEDKTYTNFDYNRFYNSYSSDPTMMEIAQYMPAAIYITAQKMGYHVSVEDKEKYFAFINRGFREATFTEGFDRPVGFVRFNLQKGDIYTDKYYMESIDKQRLSQVGPIEREK